MHERRFQGEIDRLRLPQRLALLEVPRVVNLCLEDIEVHRMLDVGTGSGIFAEAFSKKKISVTGIDPNPEMLQTAKSFVPAGKFQQGIVEKIPFKDKLFDFVFLGHVLHESDDLVKALSECKRCAKQRVAVLEWPYKEEENGPPLEHRLTTERILDTAKQIGFLKVETIQLQHMVFFRFNIKLTGH
jgi:ubiquinone/menaquinone biosynthesis C-methylase UbiE